MQVRESESGRLMQKVTRVQPRHNIVNAKDIKKPPYPIRESFSSVLSEALLRKGVKTYKLK